MVFMLWQVAEFTTQVSERAQLCQHMTVMLMLLPVQLLYAAGNATGQALKTDDFYSNELVKNYYKNHVSFILNHVNKYTGLQFKVRPPSIQWLAPSVSARRSHLL